MIRIEVDLDDPLCLFYLAKVLDRRRRLFGVDVAGSLEEEQRQHVVALHLYVRQAAEEVCRGPKVILKHLERQGLVDVDGHRSDDAMSLGECQRLVKCYSRSTIVEVATRELRNKTADLLRRVEAGERMAITVRGKPVAILGPYRGSDGARWMPREELVELLKTHSADPGLSDDLKRIAGETTDEDGLDRLW